MSVRSFVRSYRRVILPAAFLFVVAALAAGGYWIAGAVRLHRLKQAELLDVAVARRLIQEGNAWSVYGMLTQGGRPRTAEGACTVALSLRDPSQAIPFLRQALQLDPGSSEAFDLLTRNYNLRRAQAISPEQRKAELRDEIEDFAIIARRHPRYMQALAHRAAARIDLYRMEPDTALLDRSRTELEEALRLSRSGSDRKAEARVLYLLGRQASLRVPEGPPSPNPATRQALAPAIEYFRSATRVDPSLVDAWAEMARNLRRTGDSQLATGELEAAAAKLADSHARARLWAVLAVLWADSGNADRAEEALRKCIGSDADAYGAQLTLANLYVSQHHPERAEQTLRQLIDHVPDLVEARIQLAGLYNHTGRANDAIRLLQQAIAIQPHPSLIPGDTQGNRARAIAAASLARIYMDKEELKLAMQTANQAAQLAPPDAELFDTVGWLHHRMGDSKRARPILETVAGRLPAFGIAQYHLARVYEALGMHDRAVRKLDEALALPGAFEGRAEAERWKKEMAGPAR